MGFILDGLDSESYDRSYSDRELLRRIVDYFRPHTRAMIVTGVLLAGELGDEYGRANSHRQGD
jgi:hypothetical protein